MAFPSRFILLVLLTCLLFSNYNGVDGGKILSNEEAIELRNLLNLLNKPAIKTIQTEYGDTYDCVDFYKQPAFDHPMLKNHNFHFQMRPSSIPKRMKNEDELYNTTNFNPSDVELRGIDCPIGTVPIRRVTKDDLIRAKLHSERYGSKSSVLNIEENSGIHYSVVRTKRSRSKFNGGGSSISIYDPPIKGCGQYSSARMRIQNGPDSVQVGWTVNPILYGDGDRQSRLYIYTNTKQLQCFNTQCPGFVMVGNKIPLGLVLPPTKKGGPITSIKLAIFRDQSTKNWWLEVGHDNYRVGFWPQKIFTGLADLASVVEWGGEVYSAPGIPSPPMGSGNFPVNLNTGDDAYCKRILTISPKYEIVDSGKTEIYNDDEGYKAQDQGYVLGDLGHIMFFGGPGRTMGN